MTMQLTTLFCGTESTAHAPTYRGPMSSSAAGPTYQRYAVIRAQMLQHIFRALPSGLLLCTLMASWRGCPPFTTAPHDRTTATR